ncbi:MAG: hypothetical protein HYT27_01450 [Parcubacteria group bacterium]|nr:hypothetical protein [Parcubacteria group bacterium]
MENRTFSVWKTLEIGIHDSVNKILSGAIYCDKRGRDCRIDTSNPVIDKRMELKQETVSFLRKNIPISVKKREVDLVIIQPDEILLPIQVSDGRETFQNLREWGKEHGLANCEPETALYLRKAFNDQPWDSTLHMVMKPIVVTVQTAGTGRMYQEIYLSLSCGGREGMCFKGVRLNQCKFFSPGDHNRNFVFTKPRG